LKPLNDETALTIPPDFLEKTEHALNKSVKTAVTELDVILMVFKKGVHGKPPMWSDTWSIIP
jgi:hypothetical protein